MSSWGGRPACWTQSLPVSLSDRSRSCVPRWITGVSFSWRTRPGAEQGGGEKGTRAQRFGQPAAARREETGRVGRTYDRHPVVAQDLHEGRGERLNRALVHALVKAEKGPRLEARARPAEVGAHVVPHAGRDARARVGRRRVVLDPRRLEDLRARAEGRVGKRASGSSADGRTDRGEEGKWTHAAGDLEHLGADADAPRAEGGRVVPGGRARLFDLALALLGALGGDLPSGNGQGMRGRQRADVERRGRRTHDRADAP